MLALKAFLAVITFVSAITPATGAALRLCQVTFFPTGINLAVDKVSNATLAWVNGTSKCDTNSTSFAMIDPTTNVSEPAPVAHSPCSTPFSLDGIEGYTIEGCNAGGDTRLSISHNGEAFATCQPFTEEQAEGQCDEGFFDYCTSTNDTVTIEGDPCGSIEWTHKCEASLNEEV